ncbi:MAG: HD domain-containing protein [Candidatus Omnitrophica bacterium]|nr:HD domain-containing protein [Candidatus Omnitrophota bacterium]
MNFRFPRPGLTWKNYRASCGSGIIKRNGTRRKCCVNGMKNQIEKFVRSIFAVFQITQMYTPEHKRFIEAVDGAYMELQKILQTREDVTVGIVGEEFTTGDVILFDLSKKTKSFIVFLKDRGIEKITFVRGVDKDELASAITAIFTVDPHSEADMQKVLVTEGITHIKTGTISAPRDEGKKVFAQEYHNALESVRSALGNMLEGKEVNALDLKYSLAHFAENIQVWHKEFRRLLAVKQHDLGTFSHILNVAILSVYFSACLGFRKNDMTEIGIAALFHDIGKQYISRYIIKKTRRLTDEEFKQIQSHTVLGANLLLPYEPVLGFLPVVVCFEHHLGYDRQGYPRTPYNRHPHIASQIVTICDVYDALMQRRSYKRDYPPRFIYDLMMRDKGRQFHPLLIEKFFQFMGIWAVGTIVELNDKRVGIVRRENQGDIRSPWVQIISPAPEKELLNLEKETPRLYIQKALNPMKEGKRYLSFL